jgi:hypothetical protein
MTTNVPFCVAFRVTKLDEFSPFGRLFSLGSFFKLLQKPELEWYFFRSLSCALILTKNVWATFWATFLENSSGHPGCF